MRYFNNEYKTYGTAALKPQPGRDLVLVHGGSGMNGSAASLAPAPGSCVASCDFGSVAEEVVNFACDALDWIEPLPEPIAKSCEPTRAQEMAGVVACLGCVSLVLLLATFVQALI